MKTLLLIAHGSRRTESNDEVSALAKQIADQAAPYYAQVECAFLELAEPSIPDGIEACIAAGASEIEILPYFLSAGRHVQHDVPDLVRAKQLEHPSIKIHLLKHLGAGLGMVDFVLMTAQQR